MVINEIASIFLEALFPLILVAGIGALADRFLGFDLRSVNRLALYIFAPALIFTSLMKVQVTLSESFRLLLFGLIMMFGMASIGWLYAHLCRLDGATVSSAVLSVTMFNAVNFGFPFLLFAFGEEALQLGAVLVAFNGVPPQRTWNVRRRPSRSPQPRSHPRFVANARNLRGWAGHFVPRL